MHNLIPIDELDKLSDAELLILQATLRDLILTPSLAENDRACCAASLSNAVYVLTRRQAPRP